MENQNCFFAEEDLFIFQKQAQLFNIQSMFFLVVKSKKSVLEKGKAEKEIK